MTAARATLAAAAELATTGRGRRPDHGQDGARSEHGTGQHRPQLECMPPWRQEPVLRLGRGCDGGPVTKVSAHLVLLLVRRWSPPYWFSVMSHSRSFGRGFSIRSSSFSWTLLCVECASPA
jgi:hypothetical protein